ncbi:ATP-binding cassette domain-containing protein [Sorangium sp. So ce327]|uniref:ATP-binding cassette domain-containing protein n=1 Tax=Sorangium sp. So ce327 TaxID=3133301 RepID=UPI003F615301
MLVREGSVVSILGPSGAGKTTLIRAILTPEELRSTGYRITWSERDLRASPGFVPQRGALLDHLDVAGNVTLAQAGSGLPADAASWLKAVELDESLMAPGTSSSALSGGQAQRVAVARVLAAGRRIIVMDEPSVGLDPLGVRMLARLLVTQARKHRAAILVITHDLALAAGASDRLLFLDPAQRQIVPLVTSWTGPAELDGIEIRQRKLAEVEAATEDQLLRERPRLSGGGRARAATLDPIAPVRMAGDAILCALDPHLFREAGVVFRRGMVQGFARPFLFYGIVGALLGFTVPYVIANISADLRPAAVFELIKGTYILALAPPLSAIVFAATSGSAMSAWLGGLRLHGQVTALEGLGVPPARYLWSPSWFALAVAYASTFALFTLSMVAGGWVLYALNDVRSPLALLTADFVDPPPSRVPYLVRALWLVAAYTVAIASIVVAKGGEGKSRSEDVTNAMTSSVMRATLFVVVMELVTVMAVRLWEAPR